MKYTRSLRGFTVVELIVVIVIIAILAAIVVVGYSYAQQETATHAVQSDLRQAAAAMEDARNFGTGYPSSIPSNFSDTANVTVTISSSHSSSTAFCLNGVSTKFSSIQYKITNGGSPVAGTC